MDQPTLDEVRAWPPLVSLTRAGSALGIPVTSAYRLYARGEFPVPVVKVGGRLRVRTADLLPFLDGGES